MTVAKKAAPAVKKPVLSSTVTYVDSKGHEKAAWVFGTHESVSPDTSFPQPEEGQLHLRVFSPEGFYDRYAVPSKEIAESIPDFTVDGVTTNYWKFSE